MFTLFPVLVSSLGFQLFVGVVGLSQQLCVFVCHTQNNSSTFHAYIMYGLSYYRIVQSPLCFFNTGITLTKFFRRVFLHVNESTVLNMAKFTNFSIYTRHSGARKVLLMRAVQLQSLICFLLYFSVLLSVCVYVCMYVLGIVRSLEKYGNNTTCRRQICEEQFCN